MFVVLHTYRYILSFKNTHAYSFIKMKDTEDFHVQKLQQNAKWSGSFIPQVADGEKAENNTYTSTIVKKAKCLKFTFICKRCKIKLLKKTFTLVNAVG